MEIVNITIHHHHPTVSSRGQMPAQPTLLCLLTSVMLAAIMVRRRLRAPATLTSMPWDDTEDMLENDAKD